jgi:hypothetical protein
LYENMQKTINDQNSLGFWTLPFGLCFVIWILAFGIQPMGLPRPDKSGLSMTGKTNSSFKGRTCPAQSREPRKYSPKSSIDKLVEYVKLYSDWGKVGCYALVNSG